LNPRIVLADRDFAPLFNDAVLEESKTSLTNELAKKANGEFLKKFTR
jgi:hypothetical protein